MYVPPITGSLTFAKNAIIGTNMQYTAIWQNIELYVEK